MRKLQGLLVVLAVAAMGIPAVYGQNLSISRVGDVVRPDGRREYVMPSTTVVVDLTVVKESVKTGPYARFAQKYFGVIAPLADKETYRIESARIGYYDPDNRQDFMPGWLAPAESTSFLHTGGDDFPRVLPDRRSSSNRSVEDAAADAANAIFSLRKRRADLVTGEYAETVYGEGLKTAIERIDQMEQEYLELFFGKQTTTTYTVRYYVTPQAGETAFVVCRFKEDKGLLPDSDLSAEPILLECRPEGVASSLYPATGRPRAAKSGEAEFAVADMVGCKVMYGRSELGRAVIPVYQYGVRTILPVNP